MSKYFFKSMVRIRPRRVDFNNSTIKQKSISITNSENVLKFLEDCPFEFSTQFDTLIEKFALSNDLVYFFIIKFIFFSTD